MPGLASAPRTNRDMKWEASGWSTRMPELSAPPTVSKVFAGLLRFMLCSAARWVD